MPEPIAEPESPVPFEVWASPEATVARLTASTYRDQIVDTGHQVRIDDIDRLASLGVCASRYPVLFERVAPERPQQLDLTWETERLERLRDLGVEPVVTLLHHGGGPRYTSLIDPEFPQHFATYAAGVARAFPWVRRWTPINEPLTTARFSTLYGHWFPNARDDASFGRAVTNEALAMLLAMNEIEAIVPGAQFVLTEDLQGFAAFDRVVESYVAHKRERAFLSVELVMGRVRPGHSLHAYLVHTCGVDVSVLEAIERNARPPDVLGWNYYPNSERAIGPNADGSFFNVALREHAAIDPLPLLRVAHERFDLPFGLSEVHCAGDDRARVAWLEDRVRDLCVLHAEGRPVRMLGAWAAFGLVDWDSLLLAKRGGVEDGIFMFAPGDERPNETSVTSAVRALATQKVATP